MRFKSRMFPLIDVMILLLGLFLVILAQAQLTVQPDEERATPPPPEPHAERVMVLLVWDDEDREFFAFGDGDVEAQPVRSPTGLQGLVPWAAGDQFEIDVVAFVPHFREPALLDLLARFAAEPRIHVEERQIRDRDLFDLLRIARGTRDEDDD